ncbi:MAG: hypothetical protein KA435_06525 [Azonexus sp.]|jgi:hypothetical protein|nr:hypothetical protein [Azonexus sp.]
MVVIALMAIALAFPKSFDVFPVDAPIHLIGEGVTDLSCHHPERDYGNLSHLPELTVSRPQFAADARI